MTKSEVRVSKIILKVNDKEIELSLDEAKELKDILSELFGKDTVIKEYLPVFPTVPYYNPPYIYKTPQWEVTWDAPNTKIYCISATSTNTKYPVNCSGSITAYIPNLNDNAY